MQSIGDLAVSAMAQLGSESHIPAEPGDTIGEDGMLHCGVCGQKKEFRLPFNGHYVPSMCQCCRDELAREEAEKRRQQELQRVRELASYSLVDERFHESTFDHFIASTPEDQRVLRICQNYVEHFDEMLARNAGLIFYGSPGTGKTFAASCIANALMAQRVPVLVSEIAQAIWAEAPELDVDLDGEKVGTIIEPRISRIQGSKTTTLNRRAGLATI